MKDLNFKDIVNALKKLDNAKVKEETFHKDGVFRETIIVIAPYTLQIAYIDLGRVHIPLKFFAVKDGKEKIQLNSINDLCEILGMEMKIENSWNEPLVFSR